MSVYIEAPMTKDAAAKLCAGDTVYISGTVYTARDAAHKRLCELVTSGGELPFDLKGAVIYYVGPSPAQPGAAIGSAGPTTSYRMDAYAPALMDLGLLGMIGKGKRNDRVIDSMKKNGAVYFGAIGGCGALLAKCVKSSEIVAYPDLGPEAVCRLEVENLPVIVIIDSEGRNWYEIGRQKYLEERNRNNNK